MFGKKYASLKDKIKILNNYLKKSKEENSHLAISLNNYEKQLQLECIRFYDKSDQDANNNLSITRMLNKLNVIAMEFPKNIIMEYNKIPIEITNKQKSSNCEKCNVALILLDSRMTCTQCGYNELIHQVYYGDGLVKKQYKPRESMDIYCSEWLDLLQGKGVDNLPTEIFNGILGFARRRSPTGISNIKCGDVRKWLSQLGATKFYKFVPRIHRRVTRELGHEIVPPQFTEEEKQVIISDWRYLSPTYCNEYKKLKQRNKKKNNNPYYPVCIFLIVQKRFGRDQRTIQLDDYIHKQSVETYRLRLQCWENTCRILNYTGSGRY